MAFKIGGKYNDGTGGGYKIDYSKINIPPIIQPYNPNKPAVGIGGNLGTDIQSVIRGSSSNNPYRNNRYDPGKPFHNAPDAPSLNQIVDPKTGVIKDQWQVGKGNNTWLKMMQSKNRLEQSQQRDLAAADSLNQYNSGVSRLGMTGGVDAGSRARLANQSQRSLLGNNQSIANTGAMTNANYNIQKSLMDQDAERINTMNSLNALGMQDQYSMGLYSEAIRAAAANNMANAFGGGGGGGADDPVKKGYYQGSSNNIDVATGQRSPSPSPYSGSGEKSRGDIIYDRNGVRIRRGDLVMSTGGDGGTTGSVYRQASPSNWSYNGQSVFSY